LCPVQLIEKASIAKPWGSGFHETKGFKWKFSLEAKRSMDGLPQNADTLLEAAGSSFHSACHRKCASTHYQLKHKALLDTPQSKLLG